MSEWRYRDKFCDTIYYEKGDVMCRITAAFNVKDKNIDIYADGWVSNGNDTLLSPNAPNRWSCKYGHFQRYNPTLAAEDVYWIAEKAKEIFGDNKRCETSPEVAEIKRQLENSRDDLRKHSLYRKESLYRAGIDNAFISALDIVKYVGGEIK